MVSVAASHRIQPPCSEACPNCARQCYTFSTGPSLEYGPGGNVSLLTISPPSRSDAERNDRFLNELWLSRRSHPAGGQIARLQLHEDPSCDRWAEAATYSPDQLDSIASFLRSRIFNVWKGLMPQLARASASFELFNPAHGANMGWHRDGHGKGEFIAHYYLRPSTAPGDACDEVLSEAATEAMDWFEVAMPLAADSPGGKEEDEEEGEEVYALDFCADAARDSAISRACFIPFEIGRAAVQRLVVFEDSSLFHRTPLTAHAVGRLQGDQRRPIARVVFYGFTILGDAVGFSHPPSSALAGKAHAQQVAVPLPRGLRHTLEAYVTEKQFLDQSSEVDASGSGRGLASTALKDALDDYIAADAKVVSFLRDSRSMRE